MKGTYEDPMTSCPIVCGEYMRASGCFYSTGNKTYLVTARHNILPTQGSNLCSGRINLSFVTNHSSSIVDVYLRTDDGFESKRVDIRDCSGVKQAPEIDIIGIPVDFNPDTFGYHVWTQSDISPPTESSSTLDIIGFNGRPYPDKDVSYSTELYENRIGKPVVLGLENDYANGAELPSKSLLVPGIDESFVGNDSDYNGLSGSPVLGDGLVGIHSQNMTPPKTVIDQLGYDEFMYCLYTRADVLLKMF